MRYFIYHGLLFAGVCGLTILTSLFVYRRGKSWFTLCFILLAWICVDWGLRTTLEMVARALHSMWVFKLYFALWFRLLQLILSVILIGCGWFALQREKASKYSIVAFAVVALFSLWNNIDFIFWGYVTPMLNLSIRRPPRSWIVDVFLYGPKIAVIVASIMMMFHRYPKRSLPDTNEISTA